MSEKCKQRVHNDFSVTFRSCGRLAVKDGYCKQHHPDTVAKRREASDARWRERNAREVARMKLERAAPDMLEALQRLVDCYSSSHSPETRESCWAQAKAAIKKATT